MTVTVCGLAANSAPLAGAAGYRKAVTGRFEASEAAFGLGDSDMLDQNHGVINVIILQAHIAPAARNRRARQLPSPSPQVGSATIMAVDAL